MITKKDDIFIPFIPPREFDGPAIDMVRRLPKDILQLNEPVSFFENCYRLRNDNPYRFSVIYSKNVEFYLNNSRANIIRLFLIDGQIPDLEQVITTLTSRHQDLSYYYIFGHQAKQFPELANKVNSPGEFLTSLYYSHREILRMIGAPVFDFHPHVDLYARDFYEYPIFVPAQNNYYLLNSIIGNFAYSPIGKPKSREQRIEEHTLETQKAHDQAYSFERLKVIIRSTRKIDRFFELLHDKEIIKPVHTIETQYAPLIIVAPYQNPDIVQPEKTSEDRIYNSKFTDVLRTMDFEQTENYINQGLHTEQEVMALIMQVTKKKISFLDDLAALHASFAYSPVVRLPYQGKTLNENLSVFAASDVHRYADHQTRSMLNETISRFGRTLAERTVSPGLKAKLLLENRQLVTMTDLPIEWLDVDGIPLAFTHDICRLPETALHGLVSAFTANEQFIYEVPTDILSKTLVIFGSAERNFKPWQEVVTDMSKTHHFQTEICLSVAEAVRAFRKHKPDLLIFDCHGGYDTRSKTSYLMLGNERLTGELVVMHDISAPLVFLCACNTAPTYGTINTIANAFFETQCLSVSTTYLPVAIESSSILYIRLLNNLKMAASQAIHPNWLSFLSHNIRTSYISDLFRARGYRADHTQLSQGIMDKQSEAYNRSMLFHQRRKLYESLKIDHNAEIIPEYLFYSNLGRSDLIHFQVYRERFTEQNDLLKDDV